jgi:phospholipase C
MFATHDREVTAVRKQMTRRDLLRAGAVTAAGAGLLGVGSDPLIEQVLAAPVRKGRLEDIEHVVILMQENRSFDHYFGTFPGVRGFGDSRGAAAFSQPGYPQPGYGGHLMPFALPGSIPAQCFPDVNHSWAPQHAAWNGGRMDGFVTAQLSINTPQAAPGTMGYYRQRDIPFYWALAKAFTICDRYHCSVISGTDPNRLYAMSATLDPDGKSGGPLIQTLVLNTHVPNRNAYLGRFTWTTMPEQLSAKGVSWKVYSGGAGAVLDNVLPLFKPYQSDPKLISRALKPTYPADFLADLAHGSLPQVSWVLAPLGLSEHPGLSFSRGGEAVSRQVVSALTSNHKVWKKTALFITWDENGGFFDHVAPPVAPAGTAGEYLTALDVTGEAGDLKGPIGLGFRVPMLIVSPFSRGGFVSSEVFDHTSMLRFLETRFGAEVPNLSAWRRSVTGDMTSAFNFSGPNAKVPPLPVVTTRRTGCASVAPLTVPPNAMPHQPKRKSKRPSGLR